MTTETMILIAQLATGVVEWQSIPTDVCHRVVEQLASGSPVEAERHDGSLIRIVAGRCIEDTIRTRIELTPPEYIGSCEIADETI